jgi:SpoVK/Ycf46/Vps4 family AAA+-type ATPase
MAPAVLYEEEVDLQAEAVVETGLSPEVTVATTTANPVTAPAVPVVAQASPAMIEAWKNQRPALVEQVARAEQEYKNHTGTAEFDAYVASNACSAMMGRLRSEAFKGVERKLATLWGKLFVRSLPDMVMRAFRQYLRVEVFHPDLRNADQTDPLEGILIYSNGGKTTSDRRIVPQFKACDRRFELNKPLIFLYWKTGDIWSVIVPGKMTYLQLQTFYFDDKDQKRWQTSEIISQVYLENMQRPSIVQDFAVLESAYSKLTARGALRNSYRKLERQLALLDRKIAAWSKVSLPEKQVNELLQRASMFEVRDPASPRGLLLTGPPGTGKTLVARSLAESMQCHFQQLSIADLKQQQLGASGQRVREVWNQARNNQPAVIFLDECEGILGRRGAAETDVISTDIVQAFLAEWDGIAPNARVWVIGATNRRDMVDDAILSRFGWEMPIALPGAAERARIFRQEMGAVYPGSVIPEEMASLTQGMSGRDLRHLASQVRTLAYPNAPAREHYLDAVKSSRKAHNTKVDSEASWETLVLDAGVLERLKLTCLLVRDAETWRAQGVTVPRSLLLTGPPGVGKTEIGRTLANESGLGFLAATTADVKANFLGQSGNRVKQLFERARANAPVILFLDELDIIAPTRMGGNDPLTDEIVGQLLQELDGIQSRDSEVFLLAATNHAEQIDPAVLSRFQERLAIPLPDLHGRERLLTMLLQKKRLTFALEEGSHTLAAMSEGKGMSGRDLKSWIGRAEQKALLRAIATGGPQHFALKLDDFDSPVTETTVTG